MSGTGETNPASAAVESAPSALNDVALNDFFSPEPTPSPAAPVTDGTTTQPVPAAPVASAPAAPAPIAPAPAAPAPQANVSPDDVRALRDEIAKLNAPKVDPAAPVAPNPLTDIPDYQMQLPAQVVEGLNDPDPAVRGRTLSAVIGAVSKTVHNQVLQQVHAIVAELTERIPQMTQQRISERQEGERTASDFYGKYPQYNTPMLRPIVQMATIQVGKAFPELAAQGWTPAFRDKVGEYLAQQVPLQVAPAVPAVPATKTPAAPPALMGNGSRPAAPVNLGDNEAALAEFFPS